MDYNSSLKDKCTSKIVSKRNPKRKLKPLEHGSSKNQAGNTLSSSVTTTKRAASRISNSRHQNSLLGHNPQPYLSKSSNTKRSLPQIHHERTNVENKPFSLQNSVFESSQQSESKGDRTRSRDERENDTPNASRLTAVGEQGDERRVDNEQIPQLEVGCNRLFMVTHRNRSIQKEVQIMNTGNTSLFCSISRQERPFERDARVKHNKSYMVAHPKTFTLEPNGSILTQFYLESSIAGRYLETWQVFCIPPGQTVSSIATVGIVTPDPPDHLRILNTSKDISKISSIKISESVVLDIIENLDYKEMEYKRQQANVKPETPRDFLQEVKTMKKRFIEANKGIELYPVVELITCFEKLWKTVQGSFEWDYNLLRLFNNLLNFKENPQLQIHLLELFELFRIGVLSENLEKWMGDDQVTTKRMTRVMRFCSCKAILDRLIIDDLPNTAEYIHHLFNNSEAGKPVSFQMDKAARKKSKGTKAKPLFAMEDDPTDELHTQMRSAVRNAFEEIIDGWENADKISKEFTEAMPFSDETRSALTRVRPTFFW